MRCRACGAESGAAARFCSDCGARLPAGCPSCGAEVSEAARFCAQCGASLSAPAVASAGGAGGGTAAATGAATLEMQFTALQRAMPAALRERLLATADGENRVLTILFADLTGSVKSTVGLAPEDAAARVNEVLKAMVDAVLEHEGRINRLLGDAVLAFFGTPVAHENDPERAILAALRIREVVQRLGLDVTAGINTGEIFLGAVGTDAHHEVTAMGTAINLAARLRERAAPGEILVGEATYRQTRRAFAFAERAIEAKGFAEPVPAYLVERRLARPEKVRGIEGLRADLIGRDEELARLKDGLDELRQGRGQMVALVGEAGVGKSRLVADLKELALASPEPPLWLEGRCLDVGMAVGYWPFLDLFRTAFGFTIGDGEEARAGKIVAALRALVTPAGGHPGALDERRLRELTPITADLLSVRLGPEWPPLQVANREQARQQTFLAIRDIVLAQTRPRGFVLVLDDLHWADSLSLDVVSLLMETITLVPLLLLCVYRPDREHRVRHLGTIAMHKCAGRYTEIQLRELTPQQSRRLIASLLRIDDLPTALGEMILAKAQGNPFFVEEVIRALIDAGAVFREGDGWRARPDVADVAVPETIQSVILSRVDRLQEDAKRVLQGAAVIGRVFRRRVLAHVTHQEAELDRALRELEERALIYEGRVTPEPEYSFQHQLTQDTVYHNILRRHRVAFHREVAEAIETLYRDEPEEFYEQLAYHYDRAGAGEKAIEYLVKAGGKASRRFANQDAIGHFGRALELIEAVEGARVGDGQREEDVRSLRARCYLELFRGREAVPDFERMLDLARRAGDRARELEALLGLGRAYYVIAIDDQESGYAERWRETYEQANALARERGDRRGIVRSLLPTAWFTDMWPEYRDQAAANAREALAISRELGDENLILDARQMARRFMPLDEGLAEGEQLARELEARDDLAELNNLYFGQMFAYLRWGGFERGLEICDLGIALAARLGVPPVQYPTLRGLHLTMLGRYGEARRAIEQEIADEAHPFGRAFQQFGLGVYLFELGAFDHAAELFAEVVEQGTRLHRGWMRQSGQVWLARARLRAGQLDDGWLRGRLDELATPGANHPPTLVAEVALAGGEPAEALERAEAAASRSAELGRRPDALEAGELKARALLALARPADALAAVDAALPLAEEMRLASRRWRLRDLRARALEALGRADEAAAARAAAAAIVGALADTIEDRDLRRTFLASAEGD